MSLFTECISWQFWKCHAMLFVTCANVHLESVLPWLLWHSLVVWVRLVHVGSNRDGRWLSPAWLLHVCTSTRDKATAVLINTSTEPDGLWLHYLCNQSCVHQCAGRCSSLLLLILRPLWSTKHGNVCHDDMFMFSLLSWNKYQIWGEGKQCFAWLCNFEAE